MSKALEIAMGTYTEEIESPRARSTRKNTEPPEPIDENYTIRCIEICKECKYSTYEEIDPNETSAGAISRFGSDLISKLARKCGVGMLRCSKCSCFVSWKARLGGVGCEENKWPKN